MWLKTKESIIVWACIHYEFIYCTFSNKIMEHLSDESCPIVTYPEDVADIDYISNDFIYLIPNFFLFLFNLNISVACIMLFNHSEKKWFSAYHNWKT